MSSSTDAGELKIENTNINTGSGVTLSEHQKTLVGSVLDLFAGRPSLAKLQLWKDDAEFADPITIARGRKQFEPQWYGLQTAFSEIERLSHEVTSSGNPIEMDLKTRYVVKGIGKEQVIESKINIFTEGEKIAKVEDKWDGNLPDSSISNVSSLWLLLSPFWWVRYTEGWAFWVWSFCWETRVWRVSLRVLALSSVDEWCCSFFCALGVPFPSSVVEGKMCALFADYVGSAQAFRRLNAVSVPKMVGVPKNAEEDKARGN